MSANIQGLLLEQGANNSPFPNVNADMGLAGGAENVTESENNSFSEDFSRSLSLITQAGEAKDGSIASLPLVQNLPPDGKSLPYSLSPELLTAFSEFTRFDIEKLEGMLMEAESEGHDLMQLLQAGDAQQATFKIDELNIPPWLLQRLSGLRHGSSGDGERSNTQAQELLHQTNNQQRIQTPNIVTKLAQNVAVNAQPVDSVLNARSQISATRLFLDDSMASRKSLSLSDVPTLLVSEQSQPVISTIFSQQLQLTSSEKMTGLEISAPVNQKLWAEELGQKVRWLVGNKIQVAEIRINPPHLGPIEVRISLEKEKMSVLFITQHASVRDALDAAIPKLRESLQGEGLKLVNVDVSHQSFSQRREATDFFMNQDSSNSDSEKAGEDGEVTVADVVVEEQIIRMGIVDYYV